MQSKVTHTDVTHRSHLYTCQQSLLKENERWHANLLNQKHTLVPQIDGGPAAHPQLSGWHGTDHGHRWYRQNLAARSLAQLFYEIGLHVLCLAPTNSNVDDFTNRMAAALPDVGLRRVYQAKYEYGSKSMPSIKDVPANYNDINRKMNLGAEHCYSHPIALTKAIATTTANARCGFLRKNFASGQCGQGVKGVNVIADEAAKDLEINIFNAAFEQAGDGKSSGLICLGDEEQLKDTSSCSFGPLQLA
ncbi:hypothetical protein KC338_g7074 [Hortaea werneckii]|nr:hypothetical protein KC323_g7350 [Hortaea werneckii]KAI6860172.1 hypothetical protein KC338_g7074 [Hortaea werneckii]KAI7347433.1 hypothetical protein KC320_g7245 [Hortaea werneckii]KAI7624494.1 hypothetical protein KC346_g2194 [Hortaea werneckii]KAI7716806.1 hypothetical protein KC322_g2551 [Hortaea werneckii]